MKKRLLSALVALGVFASSIGVAQAEIVNVKLKLELTLDSNLVKGYENGEFVRDDSLDVKPFLHKGSTMVPLRYLADMLHFAVEWDEATQTVTLYDPDHVIVLPVGAKEATVNWLPVPLNVSAVIKDDRTFVPVRFITEALGGQIGWDPVQRVVTVEKDIEVEVSEEENF